MSVEFWEVRKRLSLSEIGTPEKQVFLYVAWEKVEEEEEEEEAVVLLEVDILIRGWTCKRGD